MKFINFSNHPISNWGSKQIEAAKKYGDIVEIKFPQIPVNFDKKQIDELSDEYVKKIQAMQPCTVMCQGEFNFCFAVITKLKSLSIPVVAAVSERIAVEEKEVDGSVSKNVVFMFRGFREF